MGTFNDLMNKVKKNPRIKKDQLAGWGSVAAAYRQLDPDVTYGAFRARLLAGKSVVEAGTMVRSSRGRPRSR
jgi:hypothetical protein